MTRHHGRGTLVAYRGINDDSTINRSVSGSSLVIGLHLVEGDGGGVGRRAHPHGHHDGEDERTPEAQPARVSLLDKLVGTGGAGLAWPLRKDDMEGDQKYKIVS